MAYKSILGHETIHHLGTWVEKLQIGEAFTIFNYNKIINTIKRLSQFSK